MSDYYDYAHEMVMFATDWSGPVFVIFLNAASGER